MKKWQISVIVVLLALVLAGKYFQERKSAALVEPPAQSVEPAGVPLPGPAESGSLPADAGNGSPDLSLLNSGAAVKEACEGVSLKRILDDYGKLWGPFPKDTIGFPGKAQSSIRELVTEYFACRSVSAGSVKPCAVLPGGVSREGPCSKCGFLAEDVLFPAYMAGKKGIDEAVCLNQENMFGASAADFCPAAASGMEDFCGALQKRVPGVRLRECYTLYPRKEQDCAGTSDQEAASDCRAMLAVYSAVKKGAPELCPEKYRNLCGVYSPSAETACDRILNVLTGKYCRYLSELNEATLGHPGITSAGMVEVLKEREEQAAFEKRRRVDEEKLLKAINKNIKSLRKND